MTLTSPMAKNIELLLRGEYDSVKMISHIDASLQRKRITEEEAEYLKGIIKSNVKRMIMNC